MSSMRKLSPAQREREEREAMRGEERELENQSLSLSLFALPASISPARARARTEEGAGRKVKNGAQELIRGGEVPAKSGERKREEKKKESGERPYHSPPASLRDGIFSVARERYAEERKSPSLRVGFTQLPLK